MKLPGGTRSARALLSGRREGRGIQDVGPCTSTSTRGLIPSKGHSIQVMHVDFIQVTTGHEF